LNDGKEKMSTTNSSSTTTNSSTTISSQQSLISAFFMNVASPDNTINRCLSERDLLVRLFVAKIFKISKKASIF
jgi:hypothetical protein